MDNFLMQQLAPKLDKALGQVRALLTAEKLPQQADEVHHQYRDKYLLMEAMTNTSIASSLNCLCSLGLRVEDIARLREWSGSSAVGLKFHAEEHCRFNRTETREVVTGTTHKQSLSMMGLTRASVTSEVVTTVTEHFYDFTTRYELWAVRGTGREEADRLLIFQRGGQQELMTTAKDPPRPEARVPALEESVNVSWLFRHLQPEGSGPAFLIDRSHAKCKTPTRNPEVIDAQTFSNDLSCFCKSVREYLYGLFMLSHLVRPKPVDTTSFTADSIFVPVVPIMDGSKDAEGPQGRGELAARPVPTDAVEAATISLLPEAVVPAGSPLLSSADYNGFLQQEMATLAEKRAQLAQLYSSDDSSATAFEAMIIVILQHIQDVRKCWTMCINIVEDMLRRQLIAAIGKEVMPADFAEYMRYHCAKLFRPAYAPAPFSYAVRRSSEHTPEGTVSIEQELRGGGIDANIPLPIETMVCKSSEPHPMTFKLGASAEVTFDGDKYLHAWVDHRFSRSSGSRLTLVARARQFSSMMVMVGRISSATRFDPTYAAIVQNKDELTMPLELSTIPTPKEFKDAIHSLSPEQQGFAKAFRSMQLEGTLFGVLTVQIKPQLEKVLNLPFDSLTKEIKLTQELMKLFIDYQIPSDLLSYEEAGGADSAPESTGAAAPSARVAAVKAHVAAMKEMIEQSKQEAIQAARLEAEYENPRRCRSDISSAADSMISAECEVMACSAPMMDECLMMEAAPMMMMAACAAPPAASMAFCAAPPAPPMAACAAPPLTYAAPPPPPAMAGMAAPQPPAAAAPPPAPSAPQPTASQPEHVAENVAGGAGSGGAADLQVRDYTQVPKELDKQSELLDTDSALRPTRIKLAESWTKRAQEALLAKPTTTTLGPEEQKKEKDTAFDLLDALTNSGAIPLEDASLHILVAATHCFDKTVLETAVQDNMNPIEKVERSMLIMASTVHQEAAPALICEVQHARVSAASPALFLGNGDDAS